MTKTKTTDYQPVNAKPVKSFFVNMLTRDIRLEDAILDLLDNCVDGILRSNKKLSGNNPYKNFYADIDIKKDSFTIDDNCGGIPWKLKDYAFRMGRSDDRPKDVSGSVGVYGIGMKRALFKMGKQCLISTQSGENRYEVEITPEWVDGEEWEIPVEEARKVKKEDGTTIYITNLYPGIKSLFGENKGVFCSDLENLVATHYAFIINKGFTVKINGNKVVPRPTKLIFSQKSKDSIKPFIYEASVDGVDVFLAVGFTRPIPAPDEISDEQIEKKHSSMDAGWTVVCNDRAVLYCDRTELTGWGDAGVPRYHTQFIAISGVVEFRSSEASKLPTTTTKRGIDSSSQLYLRVKNKMREGMLLFTDYTNKWKSQSDESKKHISEGKPLSLEEIRGEAKKLSLKSTTQIYKTGRQYKPSLPLPKKVESADRRISFIKNIKDVRKVAEYLFDDRDEDPATVGSKCFDIILKDAK